MNYWIEVPFTLLLFALMFGGWFLPPFLYMSRFTNLPKGKIVNRCTLVWGLGTFPIFLFALGGGTQQASLSPEETFWMKAWITWAGLPYLLSLILAIALLNRRFKKEPEQDLGQISSEPATSASPDESSR